VNKVNGCNTKAVRRLLRSLLMELADLDYGGGEHRGLPFIVDARVVEYGPWGELRYIFDKVGRGVPSRSYYKIVIRYNDSDVLAMISFLRRRGVEVNTGLDELRCTYTQLTKAVQDKLLTLFVENVYIRGNNLFMTIMIPRKGRRLEGM